MGIIKLLQNDDESVSSEEIDNIYEQGMMYYDIVSRIPRSMYYAHCQSIYNTVQENRDVALIGSLGWNVINPNAHVYNMHVKRMLKEGFDSSNVMNFFGNIVKNCKALAFRSLPDRNLSAGVGKEVAVAEAHGLVIIELPSMYDRKVIGVNETRRYLEECGQR